MVSMINNHPEIKVADGTIVHDRRLDRLVHFDEESKKYPIRTIIRETAQPRSYTWGINVWLDQGQEGACVGFSWTHELASRPVIVSKVTDDFARGVYHEAQKIDEWPGEAYEGTSVLAGVKYLTSQGYYKEYRWAFGIDDLLLALGHKGPAVLGLNMYTGMMKPDASGRLFVTGHVEGGHAILCNRIQLHKADRARFWLHNSWGKDWGIDGNAYLTYEDMDKILHDDGEACIPMNRAYGPVI